VWRTKCAHYKVICVPQLDLDFAFTVRASLAPLTAVGQAPDGLRRFVPIIGGTFAGPLLNGRVVPGSGDWQIVRSDGVLSAEARYILETADGVLIAVNNRGVRHAPPEVMAKLNRGELVPSTSYYFRTSATFEAPVGSRHEWVNRTLFVATAEREPSTAIIHFFRVL
jgi:uncharacterized protein DUF3237